MKKVIAMILLLLILAGSVFGTLTFRGRTQAMTAQQEALLSQARAELDAAAAERDAVDPSTAEGQERALAAEQEALAAARQRAEALQSEIDGMNAQILQAEQELEALSADEDNAYYLAVYESYQAGMEMVEGYINEGH